MKLALAMPILVACQAIAQIDGSGPKAATRIVAPGVEEIGRIESPAITESSGVIASRRYPGVFWTHNDKGNRARLFAITREGKSLGEFSIEGAKVADWEDIAIDDGGHLYLGDIGNNEGKRSDVEVYRVDEPDPASTSRALRPTAKWDLKYVSRPVDAEGLFVYKGIGYIVTKVTNDRQAEIYRAALDEPPGPRRLEWVAKLPITSPVTGADISRDGSKLGLVCKAGAYVFRVDGDVSAANWTKPWQTRFKHESVEACCFIPEGLLATAESREIYLFTDEAFR